MPTTPEQRKAACAAYGIAKKGGSPRAFKSMSQSKRRAWCRGPTHKKGRSASRGSSRGGRR